MKEKINNWIWMPHPGHLIVAKNCQFFLNTHINKYIISTVGEYLPDFEVREIIATKKGIKLKGKGDERIIDYMQKIGHEEIGSGRKYETMVFHAKKSKNKCCPYTARDWSEIDSAGYNDAESAFKGHYKMCNKWAYKENEPKRR